MDSSETDRLRQLVEAWNPTAGCASITQLTPDASLRRYFRIKHNCGDIKSSVAMIFDSVSSPEHDGSCSTASDAAYVELTDFFTRHSISVPMLYHDARDVGVLLIEDIGDFHLVDSLAGGAKEKIEKNYRQAIDQINAMQMIKPESDVCAYKRCFSAEQYVTEMLELSDYILAPAGAAQQVQARLVRCFEELAQDLDGMQKVLVHRDFHSWNLMLDPSGRLRVIDFQDALLGTRFYDVAALLNDRDTDSMLGPELSRSLLTYFFEQSGLASKTENSAAAGIEQEYLKVLLQRDLKVAGRFSKLSQVRGLDAYEKWIPGTLSRIRRSLCALTDEEPSPKWAKEMLSLLESILPEA